MEELINNLRLGQKELALWEGGKMAISAVPGAGKSHTLAVVAAITINKNKLNAVTKIIVII